MSHSEAQARRVQTLSWIVIFFSAGAVFFSNLRFGSAVLGVGYEDDFFYYAQVARNLVRYGQSTFDGIHLTNGYHPLWLFVLTAFTWLTGVEGVFHPKTVLPFAVALETVQFAILAGTSWFVYRVSRIHCSETTSACIQLLTASFTMVLLRTGMEVGLTIFLGSALLWFRLRPAFRWSPERGLAYGILASTMVLSRLDAILFVFLLFVLDVLPRTYKGPDRRYRTALAFALGMFPIALYVMMNKIVFGTLLPISGMAKQLRHHHLPALRPLQAFFGFFTAAGSPLLLPCVVLVLVGILQLASRNREAARGSQGVFWAALLFPIVQLLVTVSLSDWQLWPWYLYPWVLCGALAAVLLFSNASNRLATPAFALVLVFVLTYAALIVHSSNPAHDLPYVAALEIKNFAEQHPGRYAMGDRSGAVGYLVDAPILQIEGLMMDKPFLDNIRMERNLPDVLKSYGVDFYISTRAEPDAHGCYAVKEPWQSGPDSPAMHGQLCQRPMEELTHGAFVNDIFHVTH